MLKKLCFLISFFLYFLQNVYNSNQLSSNKHYPIRPALNQLMINFLHRDSKINVETTDENYGSLYPNRISRKDVFRNAMKDIEKAMKVNHIPGMVMSVVYLNKNEKLSIWTKSFGYDQLGTPPKKLKLKTKFAIGSLSKAFTCTLICILLEENKEKYIFY